MMNRTYRRPAAGHQASPCAIDFSYDSLRRLLTAVRRRLQPIQFAALQGRSMPPDGVAIRHDVDLDLRLAVDMAKVERDLGIRTTYMLLTNSPLYSIRDANSQAALHDLLAMGHEVGLHCDFSQTGQTVDHDDSDSVAAAVGEQAEALAAAVGRHVRSVSFHHPCLGAIPREWTVAGMVNAYATPLMQWYLSDSKGFWREGDPLASLDRPPAPFLQILIHPIWWSLYSCAAEDRLETLFRNRTARWSPERAAQFDRHLAEVIFVRRRHYHSDGATAYRSEPVVAAG